MTRKLPQQPNIMKDLGIVVLSVVIAILLARTDILKDLLTSSAESVILGSFIAGIFFTSIFTTAPAIVILGELAQANSIFLVAFVGGIGSMIGDLLILKFVERSVVDDLLELLKRASGRERFSHIMKFRLFRWFLAFVGALIIASPLPDELGLFFIGLSKIKISFFAALSLVMNFAGIFLIGLIARSLM
ncbi:hypothetical protein C4571_00270 [Candidatus Parcubacteria bacterium]|nr:MAG: hypothetical protein C4571_00270 [Candidatus Parcubacteria bacterium]